VLWSLAPILMYPLGVAYALIINVHITPPTVPAGAALIVLAGSWIAFSVSRNRLALAQSSESVLSPEKHFLATNR
jgi:hypothetical protein